MSVQRDVFVFLGIPGSGKGTLAQVCKDKFGWEQLSTGNLCRSHIARQTAIGKEIDFAIKSGKLVSDELVTKMVENWFNDRLEDQKPVILDGYPRTLAQAQSLHHLLQTTLKGLRLTVVQLVVPDEEVVKRLSSRFTCENKDCQAVYSLSSSSQDLAPRAVTVCDRCGSALMRRKDDQEEAIRERLKTYHQHERALLDFYSKNKEHIVVIDGNRPFEEVFEEFVQRCKINTHDNY